MSLSFFVCVSVAVAVVGAQKKLEGVNNTGSVIICKTSVQ